MSPAGTPKKSPTKQRGRPIGTTAAGSLAEARRRKEWALASLREVELERRRGKLVDADAVVREWARVLR
jgi:hypothetical protein